MAEGLNRGVELLPAEKRIRDQIEAFHEAKRDLSRELEEAREQGKDVSDLEEILKNLDNDFQELSDALDKFEKK